MLRTQGAARFALALAATAALAAGLLLADRLPPRRDLLPALYEDPVQLPTQRAPFTIKRHGRTFRVTPLYDYTIHGLVVSLYDASSWFDFTHTFSGDTLNTRDLCMIWRNNLSQDVYGKVSFSSGEFTCFYNAGCETLRAFDGDRLSNNHLLAGSDAVARALSEVRIGDQVRIMGHLASYQGGVGFTRGTSTTRTDRGDGACETIYVSDVSILRAAPRWPLALVRLGLAGLLLAGGWWVFSLVRPEPSAAPQPSPQGSAADIAHEARRLAVGGKLHAALELLDLAVAREPDSAEAWLARSILLERLGRNFEAAASRARADALRSGKDGGEKPG